MKRGWTRMFHQTIAGSIRGHLRLIRVNLRFFGTQLVTPHAFIEPSRRSSGCSGRMYVILTDPTRVRA